jgi:hypothetical protein
MRGKKNSINKFLVIGVVFAAFIAGIIFLSVIMGDHLPSIRRSTETQVKTIMENIRAISELSTLSYNYRDIGQFSDQKMIDLFGKGFKLPMTKKSFIIAYDGEMKIGIDASQLLFDIEDKIIVITMPPIQILSHVIKEESVELFDEKSGLFNPISVTDYTSFIMKQKQEMDEKAYANGLFSQAQTNAEVQMETLLMFLPGISGEYEIIFKKVQ